MKNLKYLLAITLVTLFSCVEDEVMETAGPIVSGAVKLNEIMSTGEPDWIELYNGSDASVNISGYKISDTSQEWTIDNLTIPAGGFVSFNCDDSNVPNVATNFKISSAGEKITLKNAAGEIIDEITTPNMASQIGLTYGREVDGGDVWVVMSPTKNKANSTVSEAPLLTASLIADVNDNTYYDFKVIASDADGIRDVKMYLEIGSGISFIEMAPIGGGEYIYRIPALATGTVVKYYVVATDESGSKSYFPASAPGTKASFTVVNGKPMFVSVIPSNENPSEDEAINFTVTAYDKTGVKEVRLYYVLNNALATTKSTIILTTTDNITFTGTVPGQVDGAKIAYYLRVEDNAGLRTYYPEEVVVDGVVTSPFDHDVASTWPFITVAPLAILNQLVINEINASGVPYDFIELYNATNAAIDISGYKVYDTGGIGVAYVIPAGTNIASKGFYLIETGSGSPQGQFGISGTGEDITLVNTTGQMVDQLLKVDWPGSPLVARKLDGAAKWVVPTKETKGTTNN
ncbi:MAG: lamin tail domain-containing protein [Lutibacter sp.]|nr:lamin tail domain-containing protein [Lutibacter sp.]